MSEYRHHVSGFFAHTGHAESALVSLAARGLPRKRLHLLKAESTPQIAASHSRSNAVLKDVRVDGAIGTAVGTGLGALAEVALVAANVSLFIASPLIAPLVMLGWGASLGGFAGAAVGAGSMTETTPSKTNGKFADLIGDAIAGGHVVLVAETRTVQETAIARDVIQAAVGKVRDVPEVSTV